MYMEGNKQCSIQRIRRNRGSLNGDSQSDLLQNKIITKHLMQYTYILCTAEPIPLGTYMDT